MRCPGILCSILRVSSVRFYLEVEERQRGHSDD